MGEVVKHYDDIVIDMNFCSRECAVAENIMVNAIEDLQKNGSIRNASDESDEKSSKILSEAFDQLKYKVINECNCSGEEFNDAYDIFFKIMTKLAKEKDGNFDKYL